MRILVAEDDPVTRRLIESTLSRIGFDVMTAADGNATWRILENFDGKNAPELLVLDWMMPGIDGIEVIRKVRTTPGLELMYILLLTVRSEKEDLAMGLTAGANDYVAKPFQAIELESRVRVGERIVNLQKTLTVRIGELEDALGRIRRLEGMLPICSYCKKIRNEANDWEQVESYITSHSELELSHSVCPTCLERVMRDIDRVPQ
jgi:DNA-binding response OmpR family regulator